MLPSFEYTRVSTVSDALSALSTEGARLHAGGTDLLGCLHDGVFGATRVVSIGGIGELAGVRELPGGGLRIGALTTIADLAAHPLVRERAPGLAQAAVEVASPQLRNQGTVGGNLCQKPRCWYYRGDFHCIRKGGDTCYALGGENHFHCILGGDTCYIVHPSDTAPALAALEATAHVAGPEGSRTVAVADLHVRPSEDPRRETVLAPDEVLTHLTLPPPPAVSSYRKVRTRRSWDFALASLALAVALDGDEVARARAYLGGAAPVPWRSRAVEEAITGRVVDEQVAQTAARAAMADARPLAHNGYKVPLFEGMIREELLAL
jgi:xanthine dehydrogenase YagS FAD-binding subunit